MKIDLEIKSVEKTYKGWGVEFLLVKAQNGFTQLEFNVPLRRSKSYTVGRTVSVGFALKNSK